MHRTIFGACALAAVALLMGVPPAGATIIEGGHYADEPYEFSYDDCGFVVEAEGTASGHFTIRQGKGAQQSAFFINDNYSYVETHTNPETGAYFTVTGNAIFHEIKARRLEGNVFEFTAVEAGQPFRLYDAAGNLLVRDRGSIFHRAVFDTLGDDEPGGVFIEDREPTVHGPHPGFTEDLCPLITSLIGPPAP